jgi:hypothetical protein
MPKIPDSPNRQPVFDKDNAYMHPTWVAWFDSVTKKLNTSAGKGITAKRPTLTTTDAGVIYFDTTLAPDGKPIFWTGTAWTDSTGAIV